MKEYIDKCQNTEKCLKSTVVVMLRQCESQLIRAARISSTPHHWLQLSTETHSPGAELQNTSTYIFPDPKKCLVCPSQSCYDAES